MKYTLDAEKIRQFVRAEVPGFENCDVTVTRHPGGHSCETWSVRADDARWILRRPPRANVQPGASSMPREYRIMKALADTPVPVPEMIALCENDAVIGAPFLLMEEVDGVVVRDSFFEDFPDTPERRRGLGEALVDRLIDIHAVDWKAVGLERHGRPADFLQRNLDLMHKQWMAVQQRSIPDIDLVGGYLSDHMPTDGAAPTIVHGDYKLDNVMFRRDENAEINAVIDWEISTIAHPLIDLGWLRGFWSDEGKSRGEVTMGEALQVGGGFLSRDELVERYAAGSGRDVGELPWFEAFGMWKIAIIMEASYMRFLSGNSDDELFATLDKVVPALAAAAADALREANRI